MDSAPDNQSDRFSADTYGRSFADVYDQWYPDNPDTETTVAFLRALAPDGGRVVELGVGTGRLALPLAEQGLRVRGIDSSDAMLDLLRQKPGAANIDIVLGDMATTPVGAPGEVDLAFVAFNTLFNVASGEGQQQCFAQVAAALRPGGTFVVEAFVPPTADLLPRTGLSTRSVGFDTVVLTATESNADAQTITGQHIEIGSGGTRLRPWRLRYSTIAELDAMAATHGLDPADRVADWARTPFTDDSTSHITTYRKPG